MSHGPTHLLIHGERASLQLAEPDAELIAEYERMAEAFKSPVTAYRKFELMLGSTKCIDERERLLQRLIRDDDTPAPPKELSETERRWKRNRKQRSRR